MEVLGGREHCHRYLRRGCRGSVPGRVGIRGLGYPEPRPTLGAAALGLTASFPVGGTAGLRLTNSGLGPARIVSSQLTFDGKPKGEFDKPHVDDFRRHLPVRPHAATLGGHPFLDTDYQQFLLFVDPYDPSEHDEFRQLIETKLRLEIQYESIYGGEGFTVVYPRRGLVSSLPAGDGHAGGEPT